MALTKSTETADEMLPDVSDSDDLPPLARAASHGAPPLDGCLHQTPTSQLTLECSNRGCRSQKESDANTISAGFGGSFLAG